jgi:hypothetical protein
VFSRKAFDYHSPQFGKLDENGNAKAGYAGPGVAKK